MLFKKFIAHAKKTNKLFSKPLKNIVDYIIGYVNAFIKTVITIMKNHDGTFNKTYIFYKYVTYIS